jgi:transportin-3
MCGTLLCFSFCAAAAAVAAAEAEGRDGGNDNDVDDEFDDDSESVKGMARLFCEVAEAYIQLVLAATPEVSCT